MYSIDQLSRNVWRVRDAQTDPGTVWFFDTRNYAEDFVREQTEKLIGGRKKTPPKHAPLPYHLYTGENGEAIAISYDLSKGKRGEVCRLPVPYSPFVAAIREEVNETAAFIVRACNSHYELLDFLTLALPYVGEGEEFNKPSRKHLSKQIRTAIAKAEGGAE